MPGETKPTFTQYKYPLSGNGTLFRCKVTSRTESVYSKEVKATVEKFKITKQPVSVTIDEDKLSKLGNETICSNVAYLTILPKITITTQPVNKSTYTGNKVTMSIGTNRSDVSYTWQYSADGGTTWKTCTFGTYTSRTNTITSSLKMNGYLFRCCVSGYNQNVYSNAAKLTVKQQHAILIRP